MLSSKYLGDTHLLHVTVTHGYSSCVWRSTVKATEVRRNVFFYMIGRGEVSIWYVNGLVMIIFETWSLAFILVTLALRLRTFLRMANGALWSFKVFSLLWSKMTLITYMWMEMLTMFWFGKVLQMVIFGWIPNIVTNNLVVFYLFFE